MNTRKLPDNISLFNEFSNGLSQSQLARKYGVTRAAVSYQLNRNPKYVQARDFDNKPEDSQLMKDYKELGSCRIVGEKYGVGGPVVYRWLRAANGGKNLRKIVDIPSDIHDVYNEIGSAKAAEKYGVSFATIHKWLKQSPTYTVNDERYKLPDDEQFLLDGKNLEFCRHELARLYNCSLGTVDKRKAKLRGKGYDIPRDNRGVRAA